MDDLEGLNCVVWSWTHGTLNLEIQIDLAKCVSRVSALYNFAFCHDVFVETDKLECHFVVLQRSHHATKLRLAPGSLISPRFILSKGQIKQRDAKTLSPIDWLHLLCCPVLCFYSSVFYSPGFYDCRQVINIFSARLEYETVGEERSFIYISIKKKNMQTSSSAYGYYHIISSYIKQCCLNYFESLFAWKMQWGRIKLWGNQTPPGVSLFQWG